jgi:hypothetical protein
MQTEKRVHPISSEEFDNKAEGTFNGLGNIYRVPLDYIFRNAKP